MKMSGNGKQITHCEKFFLSFITCFVGSGAFYTALWDGAAFCCEIFPFDIEWICVLHVFSGYCWQATCFFYSLQQQESEVFYDRFHTCRPGLLGDHVRCLFLSLLCHHRYCLRFGPCRQTMCPLDAPPGSGNQIGCVPIFPQRSKVVPATHMPSISLWLQLPDLKIVVNLSILWCNPIRLDYRTPFFGHRRERGTGIP